MNAIKTTDRSVDLTRLLCVVIAAWSPKKLLLVAVLATLLGFTGCGDAHFPILVSITVSPASPSIATGNTEQFTATGTYSDGTMRTLAGFLTWSSSNTTVASITSSG